MKILFIGNSFSQDATKYLQKIAGGKLFVRNLYIGGCSLKTHAANVEADAVAYDYECDAVAQEKTSIKAGLLKEEWDVVSIQQASAYSGMIETYEPYIGKLIECIKTYRPNAKIVFHRTWSYADDVVNDQYFAPYNHDGRYMFARIKEATDKIAEKYSLDIIPSGDAIELARKLPEFDLKAGGVSLNSDGKHLSNDGGRYLAALVVYRFFTKESAKCAAFVPDCMTKERALTLQGVVDELFASM